MLNEKNVTSPRQPHKLRPTPVVKQLQVLQEAGLVLFRKQTFPPTSSRTGTTHLPLLLFWLTKVSASDSWLWPRPDLIRFVDNSLTTGTTKMFVYILYLGVHGYTRTTK
uniref:(northern house mosquito) hypothetical protein n=1 Tax=Culex pipiens TaxID=7175 RepID=A0A8D8GYK9_CULPI